MIKILPLVSAIALAGCALAFAQDDAATGTEKPMFTVLPARVEAVPNPAAAGTALPTWNGSFSHSGRVYPFTMVGTAPHTNTSTTVQAVIIPIKMVVTNGITKTTFDPAHVLPNGKTVIANTIASPIFDATTTYIQGGTNLGTTQYIDAFQRGTLWGTGADANYHLLLGGPTVLAEQTLSPPIAYGKTGTAFGVHVAEVDITWFDNKAIALLTSLNIPANVLPIFLTYDTYLTQGTCCIGGYHSVVTNTLGTVSYAEATYVDKAGAFSQDVSALSHEVGEWADDPLTNNRVPARCGAGAVLEVGDPEEGFTNYGAFPYPVNGFSYNLQDLVFLPYFGASPARSVNGWLSFQGNPFGLTVCSNGG